MNLENIIPSQKKAIFLAKRQLPELVYDAVNLEGINYTLAEVQALLSGITVGGYRLIEQTITLNQAKAWKQAFVSVSSDKFELSKKIACKLHAIAAQDEALIAGKFRTGNVTIAGTDYTPPAPDKLDSLWQHMCVDAQKITAIYDRAIWVFLQMARNQFFYDVNKRMGRFMMNGILLQAGLPVINLPAKRQAEFNKLMLEFYPSGDTKAMTSFMKSCFDPRVIAIMNETE